MLSNLPYLFLRVWDWKKSNEALLILKNHKEFTYGLDFNLHVPDQVGFTLLCLHLDLRKRLLYTVHFCMLYQHHGLSTLEVNVGKDNFNAIGALGVSQ